MATSGCRSPFPPKLSADQISIYTDFLKTAEGRPINLIETTEPFPGPDDMFTQEDRKECLKDFGTISAGAVTHKLPRQLGQIAGIRLTGPDAYRSMPVNAVFLTLSEIVYAPDRQSAAFFYHASCGSFCGGAEVVIYELHGGHWSRSSRKCKEWMS
jgi:hypothetical protein